MPSGAQGASWVPPGCLLCVSWRRRRRRDLRGIPWLVHPRSLQLGWTYEQWGHLAEADRMGEYRDLWEGSNLHSNDTLPTNIQQYLSPNHPKENHTTQGSAQQPPNNPDPPNDTTNTTCNNTGNHQPTPTEVQDPTDIEVDKLDAYLEATHDPNP